MIKLATIVKETNNEDLFRSYNSILFNGEQKTLLLIFPHVEKPY
jgi:hypothetical protein